MAGSNYSYVSSSVYAEVDTESGHQTYAGVATPFSYSSWFSETLVLDVSGPPPHTVTAESVAYDSSSGSDPGVNVTERETAGEVISETAHGGGGAGGYPILSGVHDGTSPPQWDTEHGLDSALGGQDTHPLKFTGAPILPMISGDGSKMILAETSDASRGSTDESSWLSHPSAIGYRRPGNYAASSSGYVTVHEVAPGFGSGMNDGSSAQEMTRISNFYNGAEENPTAAQSAPTPRVEQVVGGFVSSGGGANPGGGGGSIGGRDGQRTNGNGNEPPLRANINPQTGIGHYWTTPWLLSWLLGLDTPDPNAGNGAPNVPPPPAPPDVPPPDPPPSPGASVTPEQNDSEPPNAQITPPSGDADGDGQLAQITPPSGDADAGGDGQVAQITPPASDDDLGPGDAGDPSGDAIVGADDDVDTSWGDDSGGGGGGVGSYLLNAGKQAVMGNYTPENERNLAGTVGEILVGITPGVSTVASLRDLTHDVTNWQWSWGHALQTAGDVAGLVPFARGAVKGARAAFRGGTEAFQGTPKVIKGLGSVDGMVTKTVPTLDNGVGFAKNGSSLSDTPKAVIAPNSGVPIQGSGGPGKVYKIPAEELTAGKPYIGKTKQPTVADRMKNKDHKAKTPTGQPPKAATLAENLNDNEMAGVEALLVEKDGLVNLSNKIPGLNTSLPKNAPRLEAGKKVLGME